MPLGSSSGGGLPTHRAFGCVSAYGSGPQRGREVGMQARVDRAGFCRETPSRACGRRCEHVRCPSPCVVFFPAIRWHSRVPARGNRFRAGVSRRARGRCWLQHLQVRLGPARSGSGRIAAPARRGFRVRYRRQSRGHRWPDRREWRRRLLAAPRGSSACEHGSLHGVARAGGQ